MNWLTAIGVVLVLVSFPVILIPTKSRHIDAVQIGVALLLVAAGLVLIGVSPFVLNTV